MIRIKRRHPGRESRTRRKLPVIWQLDAVDVPRQDGVASSSILLVDAGARAPLAADVCPPSDAPQRIAALLAKVSDERRKEALSPWPDAIHVSRPELAEFLQPLRAQHSVRIKLVSRLNELEEATAALIDELDESGPRFFVPGVPVDLYESAELLYENAPWRKYSDRHLIRLERTHNGDDLGLSFPVASILGRHGALIGVSFHRDVEGCRSVLASRDLTDDGEALNVWFRTNEELSEVERELFRAAGHISDDGYPQLTRLRGGALEVASDDDVADLIDAIEALTVFFERHPSPPEANARVGAEWEDGTSIVATHVPLLDGIDIPEVGVLTPFALQVFPIDIAASTLVEFNEELGQAGVSSDQFDDLGERARVLVIRARKRDAETLWRNLESAEVSGLGIVPSGHPTTFPDSPEQAVLVALHGSELLGGLIACDEGFVSELEACAEADAQRPFVIVSGGGTRLRAGRVRGPDVIALTRLAWAGVQVV